MVDALIGNPAGYLPSPGDVDAVHLGMPRPEFLPLGPEWLRPERFRLGASSLLNDLLMQRRWLATGRYQRPDDFTID